MDDLVREVVETVQLAAPRHRIVIEAGTPCEVSGDRDRLGQVVINLLSNAIKYSPNDTQVRVSLEKQHGAIRVRFEDQGMGISSQHLPFIFERFYRAAPSSSGEAQSGGLGLAIAQAVARAQGGSIECESTLGVGSTFTLVLPASPTAQGLLDGTPKQKLILS